jgi:poly(A) polymerase
MDAQRDIPTTAADVAPLVLPRAEHPVSRRLIDADALKILFRLQRLGFTAYLTGGAVRDMMLGRTPKDFDIATDARPNQIRKYFANAFIIGRRFRLAHIRFRGGKVIEVATFRKDPGAAAMEAAATGSEAPGTAAPQFAFGTPAEDAWRRDITVNALFYDPATATVIDHVGGVADLRRGRIRVIGDAGERFREDPVRIWRVIRYAARLGFAIDEEIGPVIRAERGLLAGCSEARLYEEFAKDLLGAGAQAVFARHREYGVLRLLLGRIGAALEDDEAMFALSGSLLGIADAEKEAGRAPGLDELIAMLLWPWAAPQLGGAGPDPFPALKKAFLAAGMVVALPKGVRAQVIDLLALTGRLLRALGDGNMRWSIRQRPGYAQAARLCFMITQERVPEEGESFELLFQKAFPGRPLMGGGRPRRRRRRKPANPQ